MALTFSPDSKSSLYGKRLTLDVSCSEHIDFLSLCYTNDAFMNAYRLSQPRNLQKQTLRQKLASQNNNLLKPNVIEWVISQKNDDCQPHFLGLAALADINQQHNRAEFLIGFLSPESIDLGVALEASLLVLEFAFHRMKLHKIISIVYDFNQDAQSNTLHLGFSQEAYFHEHYFNPYTQEYIDLYQNGLLSRDFFSSPSLKKLSKRLLGRDITAISKAQDNAIIMSKNEIATNLNKLLNGA